MFGIIIGGTFNAFCNNESFYKNDLFADSKLKNKNESICLHRGTKWVDYNILINHKVNKLFNLEDLLTKSLPAVKRTSLRSRIMFTGKWKLLLWHQQANK